MAYNWKIFNNRKYVFPKVLFEKQMLRLEKYIFLKTSDKFEHIRKYKLHKQVIDFE